MPDLPDSVSTRFWFEQHDGTRLYPYRVLNRETGKLAFRVARPAAGANRKENQLEVTDVEKVYRFVFHLGYSVRMRARDPGVQGLYNRNGRSIARTSEP